MKNLQVHFSHKSDLWKTPKEIYESYMQDGYFDPCPNEPKFNGLKINWKPKNFVNPPYSEIEKWVDKAIEEHEKGNAKITTFLVPARTDTKWFHKLLKHHPGIVFIKGRLHFNDEKNPAPFPSIYIILGEEND